MSAALKKSADHMLNMMNDKENAAKLVKEADTNGDGMVDEAEFVEAGGTKQDFAKYDLDANGKLDTDELEKLTADKRRKDEAQKAKESNSGTGGKGKRRGDSPGRRSGKGKGGGSIGYTSPTKDDPVARMAEQNSELEVSNCGN